MPLDALLLQSSTLAQPVFANADAYRQVLAGQSQTYRTLIDGRDLAIFSTPLRDYANQVIGVVDIIRDRTQTVQLFHGPHVSRHREPGRRDGRRHPGQRRRNDPPHAPD